MYIIKIGKSIYEISDNNLKFAALLKARDVKMTPNLDTNNDAVNFLKQLGYEVYKDEIHN